jgi:hypothetical protein
MTSVVVEREKLPSILEEWLAASNVGKEAKFEIFFLPDEVIIRHRSHEREELSAWLDDAIKRYRDVLQRLADS